MRLIPGLENAEFLRLGQIHRNTFINSPRLLNPDMSFRTAPQVFVAGQLSGVEGYVECIATGLLAGLALAGRARAGGAATEIVRASGAGQGPNAVRPYEPPPRTTALGSLVHYITHAASGNYQPANISFDLLPPMESLPRAIARDRRARRAKQCERALVDFEWWLSAISVQPSAKASAGG
jgi:methylenetetrahydrofolate--tRNA-(uracil-5-)-methyltransferase